MNSDQTLLHPQAYQKAIGYLDRLKAGDRAGEYLHHLLKNIDLDLVTIPEFIELLMQKIEYSIPLGIIDSTNGDCYLLLSVLML
jgi:hypothetical protein